MPRVLLPLATGFEEIEVVTIADVLRRGGIDVVLAGVDGAGAVRGSHDIEVTATAALADAAKDSWDLVVLPGGEPGTTHLAADPHLAKLLQTHVAARRPLAAVCAAPRILAAAGWLRDRAATSHPSVEAQVRAGGARYSDARVVRDGDVLTSRGPGTALEFALGILEMLGEGKSAAALRRGMLVGAEE